MASHNDFGKKGEALAKEYLVQNGYQILHENWRHSRYEIDIIALHQEVLHFIEVKARRSTRFGFPEESVDKKKLRNLVNAAEEFLYLYPGWKRIQYDILAISVINNKEPEFFLVKDVYL